MRAKHQVEALNRIGMELMLERDVNVLLGRILTTAKALTQSDGGVLFLTDATAAPPELVVRQCEFDSLGRAEPTRGRVPIDDTSIAGHAALMKEPIVVGDAYDLPGDTELVLDRSFDERHRYRRRSLLFVPLVDHQDHLVGLLLLVNRKSDPRARLASKDDVDRHVLPFSEREVEIARSLAGQAAVAVENAQLYARVERTLESIVEAAVTAIDQRDPATAGHSLRVADLCLALARAVDAVSDGPYRETHFSAAQLRELRFAALLHDVGKIAVPEAILLKAKKLPPVLWERVAARFDLIHALLEVERCGRATDEVAALTPLEDLERMRQTVHRANEPSVLDRESGDGVADLARRYFRGPDGAERPYLTAEEVHFLELRRGTLDEHERARIEYHAEASYRLLSTIAWTDDLKNVAEYAYGHHEKLDGSGYPRRLRAADIPVQTRIITLCDSYDALTEADRPYKRALSSGQAIDVLREEAGAGRLDGDLLRIMIESMEAT